MMQGQKVTQGNPDVPDRGTCPAHNPFHRLMQRGVLREAGPSKIVPRDFTATLIAHRRLGLVPYTVRR